MGDEAANLDTQNQEEDFSERGAIVMETPDRKQISTQLSKFEESPVFNYLNSLSPIHPVQSVHVIQSINSLSFASPPSVFTSPHVSSLKESRFLRLQVSDPSKPEFSSENGKTVNSNGEVRNIAESQSFGLGSSSGDASAEPRNTKHSANLTGSSTSLVPYDENDYGKGSLGSEIHIGGMKQIDITKEVSESDWQNLLSDTINLYVFTSPNDSKSLNDPGQKSLEPVTSFCSDLTKDLNNTGAVEAVGLSQLHKTDNIISQHEDGGEMKELVEDQDFLVSLSNCMTEGTQELVDDEHASNLHRGMRRRCLVFEMAGSGKKLLDGGSTSGPLMAQPHINISSGDKHLASRKPGKYTPRCIIPGIGLHLNALAATSVGEKVVKHEVGATGEQSLSDAFFNSSESEDITNNSLVVTTSERNMLPAEGGVPVTEHAALASGCMVNEASNHGSPKKKRFKLENGGESETCKRCNCKKSKCLKLYCECFAAGLYCVEPCSCQECFNKPIHESTVLATRKQIESRNPFAFAPKVIKSSDSLIELGEESSKTPASARHKRGCNCKKGCLKKYCECYQGGVGCSINCRCEGCKNAFGRKDGFTSTRTEVELEEHDVDESEWSTLDQSLQITTLQNDTQQNTTFALPTTPSSLVRQSTQQTFSLKCNRQASSSFLAIDSSFGYGSQRLVKLNPLQAKFEKHIQTAQEDEMPEILQNNVYTANGIKATSPNNKRVSPPHYNNIGLLPAQRSTRKLILKSIPSFPSLNG